MKFVFKTEQLRQLFNPDDVHRGVSLQKLNALGKIRALEVGLKTNLKKGLFQDDQENMRRRAFYGSNRPIIKKAKTFWTLDDLIQLMMTAGFVSLFLGILTEGLKWGWLEGASIFLAITMVIFLSSIDDYVHEQQFKLIKNRFNNEFVRVYRGGRLHKLSPEELMVGDVLQIMGGQIIEVDGVLISGNLMIDESQITGQTNEVRKRVPLTYNRNEGSDPFLLSGSKIMSGVGRMLVLAVGQHSYYGNILSKIHQVHSDLPLKLKICDLSNQINNACGILSIITFSSFILHYLYDSYNNKDMIETLFSVQTLHKVAESILITFTIDVALPESLPLSVTIALAHTAKQLKNKKILIKSLNEAETMGGVDNICLTKTGFLTKNLLSVVQIYVQSRISYVISKEVMSKNTCQILNLALIMNIQATPKFIQEIGKPLKVEHIGDKMESALLEMSYFMGYNYSKFRSDMKFKLKRIFSDGLPKKKMGTVYCDQQGKLYLFIKGNPNYFLSYCTSYISKKEKVQDINLQVKISIDKVIDDFADTNLNSVLVAYQQITKIPTNWRNVKRNFTLIAIIGVKDSLRQGVKTTIEECHKNGITVRLLSNENKSRSICVAKDSGILEQNWIQNKDYYSVMEGSEFRSLVGQLAKTDEASRSSYERKQALQSFKILKRSLKIIYRASAEDKHLLMIGLRQCGHVVAMAGNGSNDTYALRQADVSISMARTCNQSAKQASDIIFLNDKFQSILSTIQWGRRTFYSIRKFLVLQLTINIVASIMALLGAIFLGESPLNPLQMLWTNIVIDLIGSVALILQDNKQNFHVKFPYSRRQNILTLSMAKTIIFQSLIQISILSVILFYGPEILSIPSSVRVQQWSVETGKHYSLFFNVFILLQIFNQLNARELNFQKLNIFQGLIQTPKFVCFMSFSFILQFMCSKYGGKLFHNTELTFKQNLLCLLIASLSLFFQYIFKMLLPSNILINSKGFEFGSLKCNWFDKEKDNEYQIIVTNNKQSCKQAQNYLITEKLAQFVTSKRRLSRTFSYISGKDSLRLSKDLSYKEEEDSTN